MRELKYLHHYLIDHIQTGYTKTRHGLQTIMVNRVTDKALQITLHNTNERIWVLKDWDINIIEDITP